MDDVTPNFSFSAPAMGLGEGDAGMPDDAHVMSPDEVPEHIRRGGGGSDEL